MESPVHKDFGNEFSREYGSEIYQADYQRIFRYILSMVTDKAEAEDLTQETFLRAYKQRDTLHNENAQTAWLYRIATHVSLDRLRQYGRRNPKETDTDIEQLDIAERDSPSLQKVFERNEMSECVQGYLNRLPDSYRSVILLHDMHEMTSAEIAQLLGESLATVKIRLHRARLKLRAALGFGCSFALDEQSVLMCESKR